MLFLNVDKTTTSMILRPDQISVAIREGKVVKVWLLANEAALILNFDLESTAKLLIDNIKDVWSKP